MYLMHLTYLVYLLLHMKLNGGYDFPGSNSGIDLFALTGWIPESVLFDDGGGEQSKVDDGHRQPPERVWERLVSAHSFGDCLITVSTGQMTDAEADRVGLVPTHAYAVLDVRDVQGKSII